MGVAIEIRRYPAYIGVRMAMKKTAEREAKEAIGLSGKR